MGFKGKKSKLIMLIGDRGTGVGSRIKDHLRYSGKWKQDIHGNLAIQSMSERLKETMSELGVKDLLDALLLGALRLDTLDITDKYDNLKEFYLIMDNVPTMIALGHQYRKLMA
ncbi:hypothetical protein HPULCUR_001779 [Helicostylum pulchrum]|uniref:Uncharacterized protein n=1 Tax=Helicostylum pulchrum TaxID=562976 RepID=A0ABP9XNM7_9FUNG